MTRRRLAALAPGVLAVFLATAGLPRPACVVHHHDGDEHAHIHPFGAVPGSDADESRHHHAGSIEAGGADLEDPEIFHADHAHWQRPYQWAASVRLPPLAPDGVLASLRPAAPYTEPPVSRARPSARGPPSPR